MAAAGALEDVPEPELRRVMQTDFFGVLGLTRALLPTFRAQGNGRIVLVSSEAAFMGQPTNSIYCASKWAIEGWAEAIAYELEPFEIEVILIEPRPLWTEIWKSTPRIQPPGSPYHAWVQQVFRAGDAHAASVARDPNEVSLVIANALDSTAPAVSLSGRPVRPPQSFYERQGAKSPVAKQRSSIWDFQECANEAACAPLIFAGRFDKADRLLECRLRKGNWGTFGHLAALRIRHNELVSATTSIRMTTFCNTARGGKDEIVTSSFVLVGNYLYPACVADMVLRARIGTHEASP